MEKQWRFIIFEAGITNIDAPTKLQKFLNKHSLKPGECIVTTSSVQKGAYGNVDNRCDLMLFYYGEKELSRF
jgi:hypothetical protein